MSVSGWKNFNLHPHVGGRLRHWPVCSQLRQISTHAPRVGGDLEIDILNFIFFVFQPTPPVWGATFPLFYYC